MSKHQLMPAPFLEGRATLAGVVDLARRIPGFSGIQLRDSAGFSPASSVRPFRAPTPSS